MFPLGAKYGCILGVQAYEESRHHNKQRNRRNRRSAKSSPVVCSGCYRKNPTSREGTLNKPLNSEALNIILTPCNWTLEILTNDTEPLPFSQHLQVEGLWSCALFGSLTKNLVRGQRTASRTWPRRASRPTATAARRMMDLHLLSAVGCGK